APRSTMDRRPSQPPPAPVDPKTKAILDKLEQTISIPFGAATPLSDVIKYVKLATADRMLPEGLPFYIDPVGLKEANATQSSNIKLASESAARKHSLRLLLNQLRRVYKVEEGLVYVPSVAAVERGAEQRNKERAAARSAAANARLDPRTQAIFEQLDKP